ncbi:MAG: preprotein translocase subunit SecG [Gemmataceae bacterium]
MTSVLMPVWALPAWVPGMLNVVLLLAGLFLILLVLIQRGKGGGLAGAFGGSGGSSAFGSRAGDMFTKVTVGAALVWFFLIMFLIKTTQPIDPLPTRNGVGNPNAPIPTAPTPDSGE